MSRTGLEETHFRELLEVRSEINSARTVEELRTAVISFLALYFGHTHRTSESDQTEGHTYPPVGY